MNRIGENRVDGVSESVRVQQNEDAEKLGADGDAIAIIDGH